MNAAEQARLNKAEASMRIFDILTDWLRARPECSYWTRIDHNNKIEMTFEIRYPDDTGGNIIETLGVFHGESVQDAYAQAAQAINFNGGDL